VDAAGPRRSFLGWGRGLRLAALRGWLGRRRRETGRSRSQASLSCRCSGDLKRMDLFEWRSWAAENIMLGIPIETVRGVLEGHGIVELSDRAVLQALAESPEVAAGRRLNADLLKLEALVGVLDAVRVAQLPEVPIKAKLGRDEFFEQFYGPNVPVVITDFASQSNAVKYWSLDSLRSVLGESEVEVMSGREADADYEKRADHHRHRIRFAAFIDSIVSGDHSNDTYLVANNRLLDHPEAKPLWSDLPDGHGILDPTQTRGNTFLWVGPGGTITPLHYDLMNVLLVQLIGWKRVRLIPSTEMPLVYNDVGVFSQVDLDAPDLERFPRFADVHVYDIKIGPGHAVFIPVGWWHHVVSLNPSVSVSFVNFAAPNRFSWK
jgi:hypothetical protein